MPLSLRAAGRTAALSALLAGGLGAAPAAAQDVTIGWTAWSDAEFVTKLARQILEDRMDMEVELIQTDIAIQYQGLAQGDIDIMLMSWQPVTHQDYVEEFGDQMTALGTLYTGARLGWVVPSYVPEDQLSSIEDLLDESVREQLDGQIQGIDPGAGLMRLSNDAVEAYGLDDYELVSASGAAMTAALDRAIQREEWIVVTGWSPHWKFGAYDLRYLEDPMGVLGGPERAVAMARNGFYQDNVEAASFFARLTIPLDELEAAMYDASQRSYEEAVDTYIANHEARVNYWVTGEIAAAE
ncbi:MAG: glycine/betaine ABC transporter substrate-binding protein [Alphaproteobacteria bacterium]|jgi:glycine betaine/proline transport system substrate-binding protein|nr:glycine/betaine ABC transporter substrate-binding protein [Alphaproteobacteria bacterium]